MNTTYQDAMATVASALNRAANRVTADIETHRVHPSYVTRKMATEHLHRMRGALEVFRAVYALPVLPTHIDATVNRAESEYRRYWIDGERYPRS